MGKKDRMPGHRWQGVDPVEGLAVGQRQDAGADNGASSTFLYFVCCPQRAQCHHVNKLFRQVAATSDGKWSAEELALADRAGAAKPTVRPKKPGHYCPGSGDRGCFLQPALTTTARQSKWKQWLRGSAVFQNNLQADLAPRYRHIPHWSCTLVAGDEVEVKVRCKPSVTDGAAGLAAGETKFVNGTVCALHDWPGAGRLLEVEVDETAERQSLASLQQLKNKYQMQDHHRASRNANLPGASVYLRLKIITKA